MSVEVTELLISEVKKHPELYDTNCSGYRDSSLRNRIFEEIAKKLGGDWTSYSCKQKWKNLRDTYLKHLRGAFKPQSKPWSWKKEMSFLEPHMLPLKKPQLRRKAMIVDDDDSEYEMEEEYLEATEDTKITIANSSDEDSPKANVTTRPDPLHEDLIFHSQPNTSIHSFDDMDLIFLGYAKTIKKLKKSRQIKTKFRIAQVIMDAELEELGDINVIKRDPD